MKQSRGLGFKLSVLFGIFTIVTVILCGVTTYMSQMLIYRGQCERNIKNVAAYLASLTEADGEDFAQYRKYYEDHYAEVNIPIDADEYLSYEVAYEELFAKKYPGKTLGVDIEFEELDEDVQHAWFVYTHLYWLLTFEQARADFNLPYSYFLIPDENEHNVMYMIDGERLSRAGHIEFITENPEYSGLDNYQGEEAEYMYLADTYHNDLDYNPVLWKTWETGEAQEGYMVWHNQWGDTYSYYVPVWIDHEKLGLVVTEIDIADVNTEIMKNTLRQIGVIALVLIATLAVAIYFINKHFIAKILRLESSVQEYTVSKDSAVVAEIEQNIKGHDEIVTLSEEIISMIIEIENYIKSLVQVNNALADEKSNSARMSDLAHKDALTGIRNRTAYEKEVQKLEWDLADGETDFGIAMIDLNFLKRINDTYGHEQGNYAIKKLCYIVCHVFEHSPVFRIGGDEFVAILRGHDFDNREDLVEEFKTQLEMLKADDTLEPWEKVSAAIGVAIYDKIRDSSVDNVFKRADQLMYENKKEMKAVRV